MTALLQRFEDITKKDILTAGGKGANLGEMVHAGIPVPEGAVLTTEAYRLYVKENKIDLKAPAEEIRKAFLTGSMPKELHVTLLEYYIGIGEGERIAVRSSATAEDLEDASFAGQQETYLNVRGEEELTEAVKRCYASLWGDRAVSYRREKGYEDENVALAVVIQKMVESETAGVVFTINPASGKKEEMLINASYGLGESVVSGVVSPDELVCDRLGNVIKCQIGAKETQVVYGEKQTVKGNILPSVDHLYVLSRLLKVHMEDLLVPKCEYSIFTEKYGEKSLGEKRLYEYWKRLCIKKCA